MLMGLASSPRGRVEFQSPALPRRRPTFTDAEPPSKSFTQHLPSPSDARPVPLRAAEAKVWRCSRRDASRLAGRPASRTPEFRPLVSRVRRALDRSAGEVRSRCAPIMARRCRAPAPSSAIGPDRRGFLRSGHPRSAHRRPRLTSPRGSAEVTAPAFPTSCSRPRNSPRPRVLLQARAFTRPGTAEPRILTAASPTSLSWGPSTRRVTIMPRSSPERVRFRSAVMLGDRLARSPRLRHTRSRSGRAPHRIVRASGIASCAERSAPRRQPDRRLYHQPRQRRAGGHGSRLTARAVSESFTPSAALP